MYETWEELESSIQNCSKCKLCQNRHNIVFGDGKAGQLMNKAFQGLGIKRNEVYIANIVKCRPPSNRVPEDDEAAICLDYLRNQVVLVKPKIIVLLGSTALKNILGKEYGITSSRGNWVEQKGIYYMPTWHPAALLRDENKKIEFWKDLKEVVNKYQEIKGNK